MSREGRISLRDDSINRYILNNPEYNFEFGKFFCRILQKDDDVQSVVSLPLESCQITKRDRSADILLRIETRSKPLLVLAIEVQSTFSISMHERILTYCVGIQDSLLHGLYVESLQSTGSEEGGGVQENLDHWYPHTRAIFEDAYAQLPEIFAVLINTGVKDWRRRCFKTGTQNEFYPIDCISYAEFRQRYHPDYNKSLIKSLNYDLTVINMYSLGVATQRSHDGLVRVNTGAGVHQVDVDSLRMLQRYILYYQARTTEDKVQYLHKVIGFEHERAVKAVQEEYLRYCLHEEGREEGREEGLKEAARRMKEYGISVEFIASVTGLESDCIELL